MCEPAMIFNPASCDMHVLCSVALSVTVQKRIGIAPQHATLDDDSDDEGEYTAVDEREVKHDEETRHQQG